MDLRVPLTAFIAALVVPGELFAATFSFGSSQNGIDNMPTASITVDEFTLDMTAGPPGAVINEAGTAGMGIISRAIAGVIDPSIDKFDVLRDENQNELGGETLTFSFNRPGLLTGINFDGVKDEALEYFILAGGSNNVRINFFDSAANVSVAGAVDQAVAAGKVTGDVVYLLEINAAIDDEAQNLAVPFNAGDEFLLTYAELGDAFNPSQPGNGSRLQGITVQSIPEPAGGLLLLMGGGTAWLGRRWQRPLKSHCLV